MKNIEYLELFFKKHKLKGKIRVRYADTNIVDDDYMSEIVFENGDVIHINDVIFDIESELEDDVVEQWLESKRKSDISLSDWMQTNNHYFPKYESNPEFESYKTEITSIIDNVKRSISRVFELQIDENEKETE